MIGKGKAKLRVEKALQGKAWTGEGGVGLRSDTQRQSRDLRSQGVARKSMAKFGGGNAQKCKAMAQKCTEQLRQRKAWQGMAMVVRSIAELRLS